MRFAALFGALGLVCSGVPANAQPYSSPMGFKLKKQPSDPRAATANAAPELTMMRTAKCLAADRADEVRAYLETVPASAMEEEAYVLFAKKLDRCMPEMDMSSVGNLRSARGVMTMRFDHSALRGALAESMLREEDVPMDPAALSLGDEGMDGAERFHGARSVEMSRMFALGFAGCVMGLNPDKMEALFQTMPGSAEEKSAIVEMAPSFSECVMEGQVLKLSAPTLRNQLAEVTYYAVSKPQNAEKAGSEDA